MKRGTPSHDVAVPIWPLPQHATATSDVQSLTLLGLLTDWQWDWFAGPMLLPLVGVYLWGVSVLRRRGDGWSRRRTTFWMVGMAQLADEERALASQEEGLDDQVQEHDSPQEAGVSGGTMQPLPADTRTEE